MADKKITALTAATAMTTDDLVHIVDSPASSPTNKKMTQADFFGNTTPVPVRAVVNTAPVASGTATTAGDFRVTTGGATTAINRGVSGVMSHSAAGVGSGGSYAGVYGSMVYGATNANVSTYSAGVWAEIDPGTGAAIGAAVNTNYDGAYGLVVKHAQTGTRASSPAAFIAINEQDASTKPTGYLMDIGMNTTGNVNTIAEAATGASSAVVVTGATTGDTSGVRLRIRINATDYWIMCTATAPANSG